MDTQDNLTHEPDSNIYEVNMYDDRSFNNNNTVTTNDSTVYSSPQAKRRALAEYMKQDPGYRCIGKKKDKLEYFSTSTSTGTPIRGATTGIREYHHRVGNPVSEYQFFKVRYVGNGIENGPDTLFYDTPEHFERHMGCNVNTKVKKSWKKNYQWATSPQSTV
tara:strand:+ start:1230 stop:1715 length:486 start_codon:yes stop_codon:yes gene_type:complete